MAATEATDADVYALVLGRVVLSLREKQGLTQTDLAQRAGLTQSTLSRIERGQSQPDAYTFGRLAQALSLTVEQLSKIVDDSRKRAEEAARVAAPSGSDDTWWKFLGWAALAGLVIFAVAVVLDSGKAPRKG